ncbi:6-bladed beta-propeller [Belliella sp. DSM 111904]|uniref:6-bladed beta-propeller n=1 Tax=Belliella filtrata TaxID=2923435 RepID=A0ABS9V1V7_9BACT|nr:6-bladed beta-propeller [Belliella filtrata]MCH7410403.1 6-bladed beta-propeller [Belliella filtrata]
MRVKIIGVCLILVFGCTRQSDTDAILEKNGIITIKVDLDIVRDGKLTDFFEPEIEYLFLQEGDNPDAQIGEIAKLISYEDKLLVFDWYKNKNIQIFDRQGNFLNRIRSLGEGPEKYLELADLQVVQDTIYVLAHPSKIMKYNLQGKFISEFKFEVLGRTFYYDTKSKLFFIYSGSNADHLVSMVDHSGKIIENHFASRSDIFLGNMSDPYNFYEESEGFYFAKTYNDTLYSYENGQFEPKIIFDYGKRKMNHSLMLEKESQMNSMEFFEYFRVNSGMSFFSFGFSNSKYLMTRTSYNGKAYVSIFDKQQRSFDIINFNIENDIDESLSFYQPSHNLGNGEVAIAFRGATLYGIAMDKKQNMSTEDWEAYQNGLGKSFVEAAFYAKDSENYVLLILKTKK